MFCQLAGIVQVLDRVQRRSRFRVEGHNVIYIIVVLYLFSVCGVGQYWSLKEKTLTVLQLKSKTINLHLVWYCVRVCMCVCEISCIYPAIWIMTAAVWPPRLGGCVGCEGNGGGLGIPTGHQGRMHGDDDPPGGRGGGQ